MNWTGGGLHRHSNNKAGNLSRVQKQSFAKAKSRASKGLAQASPFENFAQFRNHHRPVPEEARDTHPLNEESCRESAGQSRDNQDEQPLNQNPSSLREPNLSKPPNRLDRIKQQLLEKSDWVSLAPTRPLKMTFTDSKELQEFGKRRKLTEADRRRLASSTRKALPLEHRTIHREARRDSSSGMETIEGLDIRINGQRPGAKVVHGSQHDLPNHQFSQPMLLDSQDTTYIDWSSTQKSQDERYTSRAKTDSSHLPLVSDKSAPQSEDLSEPPSHASTSRVRTLISQYLSRNDEQNSGYLDDKIEPEVSSGRCRSRSLSYKPEPVRRRFTIDDQILAEIQGQMGFSSAEQGRPTTSHRPNQQNEDFLSSESELRSQFDKHTLDADIGHLLDTHSCSSNVCSGSLPEPKCNIQRPIDGSDANLNNFTSPDPCLLQAFPRAGDMERHDASPVTIFGQSVSLGDSELIGESENSTRATWIPCLNKPPTPIPQRSHFSPPGQQESNYMQNNTNQIYTDQIMSNGIYSEPFRHSPRHISSFAPSHARQNHTPSIIHNGRGTSDISSQIAEKPDLYSYKPPSAPLWQGVNDDQQSAATSSSPDPLSFNPGSFRG